MPLEGWIALAATLGMVAAMARGASPDLVLLGGLVGLTALGVVPVDAAVAGFANPAMLTVGALFVVAAGVRETGGLDATLRRVLGRGGGLGAAQLRMMLPVSAVSAFLNNTPVVAMMVPVVGDWARRTGLPLSRLLIPLSYASILGGTCTLLGTSTNLVVAGLLTTHDPAARVGLFDVAWLGVPALLVGTGYVLLMSPRLLPDRPRRADPAEAPREYTVALRVEAGSPIVGETIEDAGLRHLPGLYLAEIAREGELMPAVAPTTRIHAADRLVFVGVVESVVDLRRIRGLVPDADETDLGQPRAERTLLEAVVGRGSPLLGKSVRDLAFRTRYGAVIVAVHRNGERLPGKIGDLVLAIGDVLLLEAPPSFGARSRHDAGFALVTEVDGSAPPRHDRAPVALGLLAAMVALSAAGALPLLTAAALAAGGMLLTRCLSPQQARRALELRVLLAIAAAFGVAAALEHSGAAGAIGRAVVELALPLGPVAVLAAVYLATMLLTELVTNNAAAALMFPVVVAVCDAAGVPLVPAALVTMMAASASFATPIGYQTNLMVYGPGGYRFADFFRFGAPLQVLLGAVTVTVAALRWL